LEAEMRFLKKGLNEMFIPFLCDFCTNEMGVLVRPRGCFVTDSSKVDVKFSVHLVVTTPEVHYFRDRVTSWVAMCALAAFFDNKTKTSPEFHRWFFYVDEKSDLKTTWDYGIYNGGARNMRLIGACKANKQRKYNHWTKSRVFVPADGQRGAPYHNFIASAYAYSAKREFPLPDNVRFAAYAYCHHKQAQMPSWFKNSRNLCNAMRSHGLITENEISSLNLPVVRRATSGSGSRSGSRSGGGVASGHMDDTPRSVKQALREITEQITTMGQEQASPNGGSGSGSGSGAPRSIIDLASQDMARVRNNYYDRVSAVLRQAATKYHPGNPVTITMCYDNFRVAEARCNAWIDGNSGAGRRCYFGCTSGSHQVSISCRADFQLSYYCWGCNKRGVLMKTPIKAGHVRPRNMATDPIPDDFQN